MEYTSFGRRQYERLSILESTCFITSTVRAKRHAGCVGISSHSKLFDQVVKFLPGGAARRDLRSFNSLTGQRRDTCHALFKRIPSSATKQAIAESEDAPMGEGPRRGVIIGGNVKRGKECLRCLLTMVSRRHSEKKIECSRPDVWGGRILRVIQAGVAMADWNFGFVWASPPEINCSCPCDLDSSSSFSRNSGPRTSFLGKSRSLAVQSETTK